MRDRKSRLKRLGMIAPLAIVGALLFVALGGVVVRELWNWLVPSIFALKTITFLQAVGLLALSRILMGRFGGFGGGPRRPWRHRMHEMSPDERERFREAMRGRAGDAPIA